MSRHCPFHATPLASQTFLIPARFSQGDRLVVVMGTNLNGNKSGGRSLCILWGAGSLLTGKGRLNVRFFPRTSTESLQRAFAFYGSLGKISAALKDCNGLCKQEMNAERSMRGRGGVLFCVKVLHTSSMVVGLRRGGGF